MYKNENVKFRYMTNFNTTEKFKITIYMYKLNTYSYLLFKQ